MSKFPTTIKTASVARVQLQAMTCTEEKDISSRWLMVDLFVWFVMSWSMQTLYLVLHEKQTCSDLQVSLIMVIFLQMTFNKCNRRQSGCNEFCITGQLIEEQRLTIIEVYKVLNFRQKLIDRLFSLWNAYQKNYSKFVKIWR